MADKVQLIKEEIEKELTLLDKTSVYDTGRVSELNHLKLFIDSLPEDLDFNIPKEPEQISSFDWQSFRAEAAKDILCSIIQGGYAESRIEYQSKLAVQYSDELIKQLKEKEEK